LLGVGQTTHGRNCWLYDTFALWQRRLFYTGNGFPRQRLKSPVLKEQSRLMGQPIRRRLRADKKAENETPFH
jgi:hypothetical protein